MIKVRYSKVCGRCMLREPLTSGMVGQTIHFEYSHDFDGLMITAVFTDGKNTINVVNPGNECVIPHEVLTTVGAIVKVGIYAVKDDELVIPTIYATIGTVLKGADPSGDISVDPTLPVWAQVQNDVGNLNDLTTEAKNNLVSAINEVAASGGGGADWAQNNPDGDGYVKNRPGGYLTDPVITDADTFTITSAEDVGGFYMAEVAVESSAITLSDYVIGDGVIVDFGEQSYSLTWQLMESFPSCGAAVTGEALDWSAAPFCIIAVFGGDGGLRGYYIYLQNEVTSPIQVKLKMSKQTPVKIPEKYLELDSAKEIVLFTIRYNRSDDTYVSDRTYEELTTALNSGKLVVAKFGNVGMGELYSYGLLCQAGMYVACLYVYVPSYQPYRWYCTGGNVWTKRELLNLEMEIDAPFYERDVGKVLTQVKSSGEYYKYKYAPKSVAGYGVKYIAEGYIGENNEFICTTSSEEVISRCSEIDDGCLCAIRIIDEDSYTIAIAEGGLCGDKGMTFSRVYTDGRGNLYTLCCSLNIESDTVSWSTYKHENITNNYIELPDVSADDDGKLLGVIDGAWGKVDKPSNGGLSLGLTSAVVGQIAKITAVDASGTPTAWEPADMPSGGGAITYDIAATAERSVQNNTLQGFTCSVSSKQLRKAIDTGKTPRLVIKIRTTTMYMPMTNYFLVGAEYAYVNFGCVDEYGLENVVCDGESEVDAGKPIWLASSSFVTPTY